MEVLGRALQQTTGIIRFLLTYDSTAFDPVAGPWMHELEKLVFEINGTKKTSAQSSQVVAFVKTLQAFNIVERLERMWLETNPPTNAVILHYIKRVTCEVSIARSNMIHPERPITQKDCCIFDIDDTLLHEDCSVLARAVLPELVAWMQDLGSLGYSIILLTARTTPHPSLEAMLVAQGIHVHRYICAPSSTYDSCNIGSPSTIRTKRFERSKLAKKQARIQLKAEDYNICLTVGNLVGDLEEVGNRYLLPERCMPRRYDARSEGKWPSSSQA